MSYKDIERSRKLRAMNELSKLVLFCTVSLVHRRVDSRTSGYQHPQIAQVP